MTVAELRDKLKGMPDDGVVFYIGPNHCRAELAQCSAVIVPMYRYRLHGFWHVGSHPDDRAEDVTEIRGVQLL